MTLRGCSAVVHSRMKCHLEFDKIWRNNPLRVRRWTPRFLILFTRYNQDLSGDPCHCAIKLIIFHKNYRRLGCLEVRVTAGTLVLLKWLDLLQIFHVLATNLVPSLSLRKCWFDLWTSLEGGNSSTASACQFPCLTSVREMCLWLHAVCCPTQQNVPTY